MPARAWPPVGAPCWIDLMTSDVGRSQDFYGELFGWAVEQPDPRFGGYFNFVKDGARVAGCMGAQPGYGCPDVWSLYLATDDIKTAIEATLTGGGQVLVDRMAVAELGDMAVVLDAGAATIGLWQPGTHPGFGQVGEPNAPGWFELDTRDFDAALAFYREVFGWRTEHLPELGQGRYAVMTAAGRARAGVADAATWLAAGTPAHWSVYFAVPDTDAALARVARLGGRTVRPAQDTRRGRLATAADATGSVFKLVAPNDAGSRLPNS